MTYYAPDPWRSARLGHIEGDTAQGSKKILGGRCHGPPAPGMTQIWKGPVSTVFGQVMPGYLFKPYGKGFEARVYER